MYAYKNKVYKNGRSLVLAIAEDTDIQYQPNIIDLWSDAALLKIGVTKITPEPKPDSTYYIVGDLNVDGTWVSTPRSEADIEKRVSAQLSSVVQGHLDTTAQENGGWDNMMSARAAAEPVEVGDPATIAQMKNNALGLKAYYYTVWSKCFEIQYEVQNNLSPIPTEAELIALLPVYGA